MKQKINIIGSIFDTTGYASHTRSLASELYKLAEVKLTVPLIENWQRFVNDAELAMITKQLPDNCINLLITTPHNWKLYTGLGMNIGYCVWEGDKVPESYIEEFLNPNIDLIFVPSTHTANAILTTAVEYEKDAAADLRIEEKLVIIPHGVDKSLFYPKEKKSEKFTFVCNKGWRGTNWDRGGVQYILKAFSEEFKKEENVRLVLKLNPAYINGDVLNQAVKNMNLPETRAQIDICLDNITFDKLVDFYADGDVYVCATRAEAFNLPGMEAMACGLPTIQTEYGGQMDYMEYKNSFFIPYKLEEIKEDLMYEGIKWATPDIKGLQNIMRHTFENQDKVKEMGKQALEDSKNWTWDISAKKVVKSIENSQK